MEQHSEELLDLNTSLRCCWSLDGKVREDLNDAADLKSVEENKHQKEATVDAVTEAELKTTHIDADEEDEGDEDEFREQEVKVSPTKTARDPRVVPLPVGDADNRSELKLVHDGAAELLLSGIFTFWQDLKEAEVLAEGRPPAQDGVGNTQVRNEGQSEGERAEEASYFRSVPGCNSETRTKGDEIEEEQDPSTFIHHEVDCRDPWREEEGSGEDVDESKEFVGEEFQEAGESFAELPSDVSARVEAEARHAYLEMNSEKISPAHGEIHVTSDLSPPEGPSQGDHVRMSWRDVEDLMEQTTSGASMSSRGDFLFEADVRNWDQEQERITAFYQFYDDSDEDEERAGRMIKVKFPEQPLSQVIHYDSDSTDVESLRSSSDEENHSVAETSDDPLDSEDQETHTLVPNTESDSKQKGLQALELLLRMTLVFSLGLLVLWFALEQLRILQPYGFL